MSKTLWINLAIGASVGAIAFSAGALNLPLSLAACFVTASVMNVLMLGRRS